MGIALATRPKRTLLLGIALLSAAACGSAPKPGDYRVVPQTWRQSVEEPRPELEGELAAAVTVGLSEHGGALGGDMRAGNYIRLRRGVPVLLGNRVGYDVRLRILYGRGEEGALTGHFLLGVTPSITQEVSGPHEGGRVLRFPSVLGVLAPETGGWLRADAPTRFYLGWRAPITILPNGEAGLELVPSFVWAPAGAWLTTLSGGGFWR